MYFLLVKSVFNCSVVHIQKSILCRKKIGSSSSFIEKLKVLFAFSLYPLYFFLWLKYTKKKLYIIELGGDSIEKLEYPRAKFCAHYFSSDEKIEEYLYHNGKIIYYNHISFKGLISIIHVWFHFFKCSFLVFKSSRFSSALSDIKVLNVIVTGLLSHSDSNFYLFRLYQQSSYFISLFLSSYLGKNTFALSGNSFMNEKRYSYFPKVHFCLCSKFQEIEWSNYIKLGWAKCYDIRMTGVEEYYLYKDLKTIPPKYDIGVYSSGWWARELGIYQTGDIEGVRNLKYANNEIYKSFVHLLCTLHELKNTYGYSVIVYPHPYERRLFNDYGIRCPYLEMLNSFGFVFDDDKAQNSIMKLFESKLGIAMGSTIVADRWNLGLAAISYQQKDLKEIMPIKYLGYYQKYFFDNIAKLKIIIPSFFSNDDL